MTTILEERLLPVCGKCEKKCQKCEVEPIFTIDGNAVKGRRLIYFCHGASAVYEILEEWWTEFKDSKPFVPIIFEQPLKSHKPESIADVVKSQHNGLLRDRRNQVWQFILHMIAEVVEAQKGFKPGENAIADWCHNHNLRLEQDFDQLRSKDIDVRYLVVNTKTVLGYFEIPFYADQGEWKFIPTAKK